MGLVRAEAEHSEGTAHPLLDSAAGSAAPSTPYNVNGARMLQMAPAQLAAALANSGSSSPGELMHAIQMQPLLAASHPMPMSMPMPL